MIYKFRGLNNIHHKHLIKVIKQQIIHIKYHIYTKIYNNLINKLKDETFRAKVLTSRYLTIRLKIPQNYPIQSSFSPFQFP